MTADIYGKGLSAYFKGDKDAVFTVDSDVAETEEWPVETFFRAYEQMPEVEQLALKQCTGAVLDVGAGAGSHALWLQSAGKDVTAIDISPGAIEVMRGRGVQHALLQNYFTFKDQQFDTLLMLMNGIGITGSLDNISAFFNQAKKLLNPGGKILLDSSDIIYLFEEEDGSVLIDLNAAYYGELEYTFSFEGRKGEPFKWLFVDFDTLADCASLHGFSCEKLYEDEHYLYLAELVLSPVG